MFRTGFLSHHQESSTVYTAIGICYIYIIFMRWVYALFLCSYIDMFLLLFGIDEFDLLLCIQYQIPDDGQKTCPKRIEFYSENKYHDTRSSGCQTSVHLRGFYYKNISRRTVFWMSNFSASPWFLL